MTAAALSFEPAAAPTPGSTPALPSPKSPVGDFAGMVDGRLRSRSDSGKDNETGTTADASPNDSPVELDAVSGRRPLAVRRSAPIASSSVKPPVEAPRKSIAETGPKDESESTSNAEPAKALLPIPLEVPVELIAGCLVWSVPPQSLPSPIPAPATPTGSSPNFPTNGPANVATAAMIGLPTNGPANVATAAMISFPTRGPANIATAAMIGLPTNGPANVATAAMIGLPTNGPTNVATAAIGLPTNGPANVATAAMIGFPTNGLADRIFGSVTEKDPLIAQDSARLGEVPSSVPDKAQPAVAFLSMPSTRETASRMLSPLQSPQGGTPLLEPSIAPTPVSTLRTSPAEVVLDPSRWLRVSEGREEKPFGFGIIPESEKSGAASDPTATPDLIKAVTSSVDAQVSGDGGGDAAGSQSQSDRRQTPDSPERSILAGNVARHTEVRTSDRAGYQVVSPAGISTARELSRMNTTHQMVETAGQTGNTVPTTAPTLPPRSISPKSVDAGVEWLPNGLPVSFVRLSLDADVAPVQGADPVRQLDRIEAAERVKAVVSHEVEVLKSAGAGSLAVMLRPDPETELFVQITRTGDGFDAFVRVEKGDSADLRQGWERLQASLAGQQVRLLPLQSSDFNNQPQRQPSQQESQNFGESRGEFRDGPGFGREQRGGRETREDGETLPQMTGRPANRPALARQMGYGRGRSFESWA
jgi:hypothetical protein